MLDGGNGGGINGEQRILNTRVRRTQTYLYRVIIVILIMLLKCEENSTHGARKRQGFSCAERLIEQVRF